VENPLVIDRIDTINPVLTLKRFTFRLWL